MAERRWALGTVAVVAIVAATLSGCGLMFSQSFEDDTVVTEKITEVRFDGSDGTVTLNGDPAATEVSIHRRVEYRGSRPEYATHQVEDGVLKLEGCGRGCSVDYELDLPADLPVRGETSNGDLRLFAVGEVDVRTANGSVTLDGAAGPVVVRTNNGRVELTLDTPQDILAETDNGDITATVPAGTYRVSTATDNGDLDIGIADDPDGEHRIDLTTSNGSISVRST